MKKSYRISYILRDWYDESLYNQLCKAEISYMILNRQTLSGAASKLQNMWEGKSECKEHLHCEAGSIWVYMWAILIDWTMIIFSFLFALKTENLSWDQCVRKGCEVANTWPASAGPLTLILNTIRGCLLCKSGRRVKNHICSRF